MVSQTVADTWERMLDRWVITTDGSTVLLEIVAADLIQSEDAGSSLKKIKYASYLGGCMAIAVLSGVPMSVVQDKIRAMAGEGAGHELAG